MYKTIERRTSIRNYEKEPLSNQDVTLIKNILQITQKQTGPFGHVARFFYTENQKADGGKYGTYGFIKNPPAFIGGVVPNTLEAMVDFGYLFEEIILKLTESNLGTVWLGGTFSRDDFKINLKENEIIAAISPVGYPKNRSIREKAIRSFIKADKRIDISELFFEGESQTPITKEHSYYKYFHAVQIAPSASNKQPWRVVLENDTFHFYLKRTPGYANQLNFDIQAVDIGIALAHMDLTLKEDNYKTTFIKSNPYTINEFEYIISIKIDALPENR